MPDDPYPEQDAWGHCAHMGCACPRGGDGPDQLCSICRVGLCSETTMGGMSSLGNSFLDGLAALERERAEAQENEIKAFWRDYGGRTE